MPITSGSASVVAPRLEEGVLVLADLAASSSVGSVVAATTRSISGTTGTFSHVYAEVDTQRGGDGGRADRGLRGEVGLHATVDRSPP